MIMLLFLCREHHCTSPEMAAFLDIVHGLYGLAWKDPVEDPRFLDEYQAYYRSREDWNQVMYSISTPCLGIDETSLC